MIFPPSGSTGAPQMFPVPLQDWPLSQRPLLHVTEPLGFTPPPQQALLLEQDVPVSRQPPAGMQTVAPAPGSKQIREQQLLPPLQGFPSWVQPPPPPPVTNTQRPAPPSEPEQTWPQHSALLRQMSPFA